MKEFIAGVAAAIVIAIVAAVVLNGLGMSSAQVYQSPHNATRL
jgi:uncharacterized membrane-anchored protein